MNSVNIRDERRIQLPMNSVQIRDERRIQFPMNSSHDVRDECWVISMLFLSSVNFFHFLKKIFQDISECKAV